MTKLNMKVSPKQMLLTAINLQNNTHLSEGDVNIRPPVVIPDATEEQVTVDGAQVLLTRNTKVDVDVLSDEVRDDFVTFHYQRVSLTKLFSEIKPDIREVDIEVDGVVSVAQVVSEILHKYAVLTSDADFDYTITDHLITLIAKPTNLAFIDQVNIAVSQGLMSRIKTPILDGFELPKTGPDWNDLSGMKQIPSFIQTQAPVNDPIAYCPMIFTNVEKYTITQAHTAQGGLTKLATLLTKRTGDDWSAEENKGKYSLFGSTRDKYSESDHNGSYYRFNLTHVASNADFENLQICLHVE